MAIDDPAAAAIPAPPVPVAPSLAATSPATASTAPAPELAPVITVGGEAGDPLRNLIKVYLGPGEAPYTRPGDDKIKDDFMAGRSLAQTGDPWSKLNALIGGTQPSQGAPRQPGGTTTAPSTGGDQQADLTGFSPNDDRPVGRKLTDAARAVPSSSDGAVDDESGLSLESLVAPAGRVAKDVAIGGIETPQAVLRGMLGGVEGLARTTLLVGDAIDQQLPRWLGMDFPGRAALAGAIGYVADAAAEDKSEIPAPTSTTGDLVEQGTEFGAGLIGGKKVATVVGATGKAAHVLSDLVAGATSMDPNAPRLSNLIDDVAPNFITDWLKAKPGQDGPMMGRLKSGLEFAGLGALFEGLKTGLGVIKQAASGKPAGFGRESGASRRTPPGTMQTGTMQPGNITPGEAPEGGVLPADVEKPPLVEINPKIAGMAQTVLEHQQGMPLAPGEAGAPASGEAPGLSGTMNAAQVADYVAGRNADNPIRINLLRIGSGDDIRAALEQVARTIPEPAVETNEATIRAADASGLSVGDFLSGYTGTNLNARETTAMRFMLDSSAQQMIGYARAASDPLSNTSEAQVTFVKAFATHRALQQYFVNARAEAGRTLQAWSIMSQTRPGYAQAMQQLIEQAGENNVEDMAAKIASLHDPLQVSRLIAASERGTGRDTFLKTFYNVLLSNPRTVVKKLASDGTMVMWNLATNYAAERLGSGAVQPGETAQLAYGYVSSMKDAVRMAGKGLAAGESQFFKQFQTMDWQDQSRLSLLANGAPAMIPNEMPTQAGASFLRAALPTSWIGAADDFAKFLNYRAYLRSLAFRDGMQKGLEGPDLATHVSTTLDNVPDALHQQALAQTLRSTFQDPLTGVLKQMETLADSLNVPIAHTDFSLPVGRVIMPFVKVPANIMRWSYNNTALAKLFPSPAFTEQLNAGGATRDLAMARVWLGSAVALGVSDMALNNAITGAGPHDPQLQRAWRAAGNEPYSIQLPGLRPVSYNMVEPLGMLTGAIADTFNIMKFAREDGRENLAASLMFGTGHAVLSKTYMQGVADLFEAMNDPERSGDRIAQSMVMPFLTPQGIAAAAHAIDPFVRAHRTLMDNVESRLPIVSERLPPARTLWGDPIPQRDAYLPFLPSDSFVPRFVSPWQLGAKPDDVEPIDKWIWNNRAAFPRSDANQLGISKPTEFQSFTVSRSPPISVQVQLDPQQYDRFQELAGNGTKNPATGLGAKDMLNGLVNGNSSDRAAQDAWDKQSPAVQAVTVQRIVNKYREAAREQLLHEFSDITDTIKQGAAARQGQLQGAQATSQ
jgi:hypothetical protein